MTGHSLSWAEVWGNFGLIKFYSTKLIFNQTSIQEGILGVKIVHQAGVLILGSPGSCGFLIGKMSKFEFEWNPMKGKSWDFAIGFKISSDWYWPPFWHWHLLCSDGPINNSYFDCPSGPQWLLLSSAGCVVRGDNLRKFIRWSWNCFSDAGLTLQLTCPWIG